MRKKRLTVTLDDSLLAAAQMAVTEGRADSVSAWINEALQVRLDRDNRLSALADLIAGFESEHGVITDEELAAQQQADRDAAATFRRSNLRHKG
ncbi:MAG: hypothetical protein V3U76_19040 [Granulosicoccus sp.]